MFKEPQAIYVVYTNAIFPTLTKKSTRKCMRADSLLSDSKDAVL